MPLTGQFKRTGEVTDGVDSVTRGRKGEVSVRRVGGHLRYNLILRPTIFPVRNTSSLALFRIAGTWS